MDNDKFLLENKSTVRDSLSLKYAWLRKITSESLGRSLQPAVSIQFTNDLGDPKPDGKWVMVPERLWKEISDAYEP